MYAALPSDTSAVFGNRITLGMGTAPLLVLPPSRVKARKARHSIAVALGALTIHPDTRSMSRLATSFSPSATEHRTAYPYWLG
ncbi:MAG: hypothetical protein C4340_06275, partial [Armatimonadota bacterium]